MRQRLHAVLRPSWACWLPSPTATSSSASRPFASSSGLAQKPLASDFPSSASAASATSLLRGDAVAAAAAGLGMGQVPSRSPSSSSSGRGRRPPKVLVPPLPSFRDTRFPGPEPHVAAFFLSNALDLRQLRERLNELGCPTVLWQGQILFCGSSSGLGQQQCNAIFLRDGCVVCWHMSRATEVLVLKLAASSPRARKGPVRFADLGGPLPTERMEQLGLCSPLAEERLDVMDAPAGVITAVDPQDGSIKLTRDPLARANHQLGISLGLAVAVRLDALERKIEGKLEDNWRDITKEAKRTLNLSAVSHRIFVMETGLHDLRYELNSEAGLVDAPDLLWEHALAERLYEQVVAHHDTKRRTALLNDRLSYSFDYLHTLSEHVRHQYSVRLERIIIILIFFELCVGLVSHYEGLAAHVGWHSHAPSPESDGEAEPTVC